MNTDPIANFFDKRTCCSVGDGGGSRSRVPGAKGVSRLLLDELDDVGLKGLTVLELGAGVGELSIGMIERGASAVTGLDVSPASIEEARKRAADEGLTAEQVRFEVADAATAFVDPHDAVVADKVYCCYFSPAMLMRNTAPAARRLYALVVPESRGIFGVLARAFVGTENVSRWVRRNGFRTFVHDVRTIEQKLRDRGFRPIVRKRYRGWRVLIYERAA